MKKIALAAAIIAISTSAQAYDQDTIAGGLGYVEVFGDVNNAIEANVEYRSAAYAPEQFFGISNVSWMAGVEVDTNSSAYAYAGLLYDYPITENWSITPSVAAGLYRQGEGKDLGGAFEFKDTIEVNYKLTPDSRVGLALSHKSSAGINDRNPGTETLQVVYSQTIQ